MNAKKAAKEIIRVSREDIKFAKKMKKLGASNEEICKAIDIPIDSPILENL